MQQPVNLLTSFGWVDSFSDPFVSTELILHRRPVNIPSLTPVRPLELMEAVDPLGFSNDELTSVNDSQKSVSSQGKLSKIHKPVNRSSLLTVIFIEY
jgi:hypothetical protein